MKRRNYVFDYCVDDHHNQAVVFSFLKLLQRDNMRFVEISILSVCISLPRLSSSSAFAYMLIQRPIIHIHNHIHRPIHILLLLAQILRRCQFACDVANLDASWYCRPANSSLRGPWHWREILVDRQRRKYHLVLHDQHCCWRWLDIHEWNWTRVLRAVWKTFVRSTNCLPVSMQWPQVIECTQLDDDWGGELDS